MFSRDFKLASFLFLTPPPCCFQGKEDDVEPPASSEGENQTSRSPSLSSAHPARHSSLSYRRRPAEFDASDCRQLDRAGEEGYRGSEGSLHGRELPHPWHERRPGRPHGEAVARRKYYGTPGTNHVSSLYSLLVELCSCNKGHAPSAAKMQW